MSGNAITESTTPVQISDGLTDTKVILNELIKAWTASHQKSRERSVVITKLQEARMWVSEAQAME